MDELIRFMRHKMIDLAITQLHNSLITLLRPGGVMAVSINVKNAESKKIIQEAKIKAIKNELSLSEAVIKLLDKWIRDEVKIKGGNAK